MEEAQLELQNALTTTFLANLAFLSEYDNELYHRVDELSRMIENGTYKERYALEFNMQDGDFDIYDIVNDKYLYNKSPKRFNNDLIRKVDFDEKSSILNVAKHFLYEFQEEVDRKDRFNFEDTELISAMTFNDTWEYSKITNDFLINRKRRLKDIKKFIFMGTLLGRHIPRIAKKIDAKTYLVLERNLEIFRLSLFTVDYTILAENDGVIFSIMDDTNNLEKKIMRFLNIGNLENYILKFSTTNINVGEYIDTILKTLATLDPTTYDYNRRMYVHLNRSTKYVKDGYKIFWDGNCKNGYAYSLCREFEKGFLINTEAIALYSGEEKEPEYFIQKDNLANITMEGDINNDNFVLTTIKDDGKDFDISYQYGHFDKSPSDIGYYVYSSPFSPNIKYIKAFNNYGYIMDDVSNNEFNENNYNYNIMDRSELPTN